MNRKRMVSARKKKAILYAVAAGICVSGAVLPQPAEAVEQFDIGWDGKTLFNVKYYGMGDKERAERYLREVEALDSNHQGIQQLRTIIT